MGVGKTTAGKELAKSLNLEFIDLDQFIQNRYSKSINQIFEQDGESKFREIENNIIKEVATFENVVISTGGGVPCFYDNMEIMNHAGITIYLKASPRLLADRLNSCKDKRPLIKDKNEQELYSFVSDNLEKRDPFYSKAQIIYETEKLIDKYDTEEYISGLLEVINNTQIQNI